MFLSALETPTSTFPVRLLGPLKWKEDGDFEIRHRPQSISTLSAPVNVENKSWNADEIARRYPPPFGPTWPGDPEWIAVAIHRRAPPQSVELALNMELGDLLGYRLKSDAPTPTKRPELKPLLYVYDLLLSDLSFESIARLLTQKRQWPTKTHKPPIADLNKFFGERQRWARRSLREVSRIAGLPEPVWPRRRKLRSR